MLLVRLLRWFCSTKLRDWFEKKLAPLSQPFRSKTKTNRNLLTQVFPRFVSATCIFFEFWLVHWIVCVLCDWPKWLLWFWFHVAQSSVRKKMAAVHLTTIPCIWHTESYVFAKFIPVLIILFMLGFKVLELFCALLWAFLQFSRAKHYR